MGQVYEGAVLRLLDFGAIVQVLPGRDGLLHISEIANYRIANINDVLKVGQQVRVKVIEADDKAACACPSRPSVASSSSRPLPKPLRAEAQPE